MSGWPNRCRPSSFAGSVTILNYPRSLGIMLFLPAGYMLLVSFLFVSRLKVKKPYGKALGVMALIGVGILVLVILFGGEISGGN